MQLTSCISQVCKLVVIYLKENNYLLLNNSVESLVVQNSKVTFVVETLLWNTLFHVLFEHLFEQQFGHLYWMAQVQFMVDSFYFDPHYVSRNQQTTLKSCFNLSFMLLIKFVRRGGGGGKKDHKSRSKA